MTLRRLGAFPLVIRLALLAWVLAFPVGSRPTSPTSPTTVAPTRADPRGKQGPSRPGEQEREPVERSAPAWSCGEDADRAFAVMQSLAKHQCSAEMADVNGHPPLSFKERSGPQAMMAYAEQFLTGCDVQEGMVVVDCTEYPCVLFGRDDMVLSEDCPVSKGIAARRPEAGPSDGQPTWEAELLLADRMDPGGAGDVWGDEAEWIMEQGASSAFHPRVGRSLRGTRAARVGAALLAQHTTRRPPAEDDRPHHTTARHPRGNHVASL